MTDRLGPYRRKRNFAVTREPEGGQARPGEPLRFVVQKHAARHLHYDFRLELDGTLKSWAVPKGPSLDPADKRMAVHVEDHPLDYASFEGTIPAGEYGAGTVIVWDEGLWLPEGDAEAGLRAGKLKFALQGHKLQGRWTLVRMRGRGSERQEPWLLIKERDEAAQPASAFDVVTALPDSVRTGSAPSRPTKKAATRVSAPGADAAAAPSPSGAKTPTRPKRPKAPAARLALPAGARKAALPLTLAPQLATLVDRAPSDGDWHYELKFDGYRLLARIDGGEVRLFTRNGHDWTSKLKPLAKAFGQLGIDRAWIDGEIVMQDAHGLPDFQALQNAFETTRTAEIVCFVFDLPFAEGHDLRALPLAERRETLRALMGGQPPGPLQFSEDFAIAPKELLHTACQMRMEGLIGKRADAPYASGRAASWIKLKCTQRQEFVIGGHTDPKGSRTGLGALLLGVHDEHGQLRYAGNVGSGFSGKTLTALAAKLKPLATDRSPFAALPAGVRGHWVKPKLVAEVSFAAWTREGRVRHAVFHGLREDKPARAIVREQALPADAVAAAPATGPAAPAKTAAKKTSARPSDRAATAAGARRPAPAALPRGVRLTHPERVIDASSGITKLELAQYYAAAAPRMLPHLKQRPVALVRGPEGVGGELFFQKHAGKLKITGLKRLDPAFDPGHDPLIEIATAEALVASAQMNVIEFHTWNATTRAIDQPDRMTFDLDPGEGLGWPPVREAAELVRALLDELGLTSFLKTSGGKGLHVVVPIKPQDDWDTVKGLSQAVVQHLARTLPDRFVAKSGPRNRVGKIFVDYLRNGRGATTAAAWSVRARPGMGVSVPVGWDELPALRGGAHWTLRTALERLALPDPWSGYAAAKRQTLRQAMKALDFVPAR